MKYFFIEGEIECVTGLHIGTGGGSIEIGGIDGPIVRNPLTDLPYIPGSSLKGKMRSLLEKEKEAELENNVRRNLEERLKKESNDEKRKKLEAKLKGKWLAFNRKHEEISRHECDHYEQAKNCPICRLFGSTGAESENKNYPGRLIVRDGGLSDKSSIMKEGMIITEPKMENTIDRVTSAAVPRTIERVPAGVKFNLNLVYQINENYQKEDLRNILLCLNLIEKDGLGGNISRGSGQVKFHIKKFELESEEGWLQRKVEDYSYERCKQVINQRMEK